MATICAKKFNFCQTEWTFDQMLRICLAASCFTHTNQQCIQFHNMCADLKKQSSIETGQALNKLMEFSGSMVVMEKFINKFDYIDRIIAQRDSTKALSQDSHDFLMICKYLVAVVGESYI